MSNTKFYNIYNTFGLYAKLKSRFYTNSYSEIWKTAIDFIQIM